MLVLVLRILRYCKISGNVINRSALRNLRPIQVLQSDQIRKGEKVPLDAATGLRKTIIELTSQGKKAMLLTKVLLFFITRLNLLLHKIRHYTKATKITYSK